MYPICETNGTLCKIQYNTNLLFVDSLKPNLKICAGELLLIDLLNFL